MTTDASSISDALLALIRCPRTGEPLARATGSELRELNAQIALGNVRTADGDRIQGPWTGALVARPSAIYYRVTDGSVALAPDEGGAIDRPPSSDS